MKRLFGMAKVCTVPPVADDVGDTMSDHQDSILKLQPEVWAQQNIKRRLDILQTVCNIGVAYLGLTTPVTVDDISEAGNTLDITTIFR